MVALVLGAGAAGLSKVAAPLPASGMSLAPVAPLVQVGSGFTYQGRLTDSNGVPAGGQYDFSFKLFDAASAGSQVGTTLTVTNQTVTGGIFTVSLDFGNTAFLGDARWLETAAALPATPWSR